jgi:hypothetical protein
MPQPGTPAGPGPAGAPGSVLLRRCGRPVRSGRDRRDLQGPSRRRRPDHPGRQRRRRGPQPLTALPGADPVDRASRPARRRSARQRKRSGNPARRHGRQSARSRPRPAAARPWRTATAHRRDRALHRRGLRLPDPGHLVSCRAGGVKRAPGPVRRPDPAPYPGKTTAEIHDYHDARTGVLAASLAKRAPGYISLGFPDPRHLALTPSPPNHPKPNSNHKPAIGSTVGR